MSAMACQSPASRLLTEPFIQAQINENFKAPRHWPLWPVNSPHKGSVTRKMFPLDDAIMCVLFESETSGAVLLDWTTHKARNVIQWLHLSACRCQIAHYREFTLLSTHTMCERNGTNLMNLIYILWYNFQLVARAIDMMVWLWQHALPICFVTSRNVWMRYEYSLAKISLLTRNNNNDLHQLRTMGRMW